MGEGTVTEGGVFRGHAIPPRARLRSAVVAGARREVGGRMPMNDQTARKGRRQRGSGSVAVRSYKSF